MLKPTDLLAANYRAAGPSLRPAPPHYPPALLEPLHPIDRAPSTQGGLSLSRDMKSLLKSLPRMGIKSTDLTTKLLGINPSLTIYSSVTLGK